MHTKLYLESISFSEYENSNQERTISDLSNINILIGPNNSGKSRFLRTLFENQNIKFNDSQINLNEFNNIVLDAKEKIVTFLGQQGIWLLETFQPNYIKKTEDINELTLSEIRQIVSEYEKLFFSEPVIKFRYQNDSTWRFSGRNQFASIQKIAGDVFNNIKELKALEMYDFKYDHIYVPVLRGLRGFRVGNGSIFEDDYKSRTIKDYFDKNRKEALGEIFTGLTLYQDVKKLLLGKREDRAKVKKFEEFISKAFFEGKDFSIIPSGTDEVVHIVLDEDERPIYELGDGIQSIIILTYPLFFNTDKKLKVFYEEPDLFLHPGFQRIFIETLRRDEFKDFQFYFTTHSNHFLDMTLDYSNISVYSFSRLEDNKFRFENVENTYSEILRNLGVRNSSVFLTNCTIWVEGITDRIYIRKFLELIFKEKKHHYIEDVHFSFVEYGGNNITHWSFLDDDDDKYPNIEVERLCGKLFLITDSDNAGANKSGEPSKKKQRQEKLHDRLGDKGYYCLSVKEIENLLGREVLLNTVRSFESEDKRDTVLLKPKAIVPTDKNIGEWIDKNIAPKEKDYQSGNTLKNKTEFAKNAVDYIHTFDDLHEEAKDLSERLFDFIMEHNK